MDSTFTSAVLDITARDSRFDREAYAFVRDALDFTVKRKSRGCSETREHVSGQELLAGLREFALQQFGPMVPTVFEYWGIKTTGDVGRIVFNLIEVGIFGKTDRDTLEDFEDGFDFQDAFVAPFRPLGAPVPRLGRVSAESAPCASAPLAPASASAEPAPLQG